MRKFRIAAVGATVAALGLTGATTAAASPHASGGGQWAAGNCNFGFAANEPSPGKVLGTVSFQNCVQDGSYQGKVTCLRVEGNRATIGSVVTRSTHPLVPVGSGIVLYANDNGEPGKAGDQFWAHPESEPRETCPSPLMAVPPLTVGNVNVHE